MRRVLIVQARMTSTRLPGKVLEDLAGRPMLARQLGRLRACRNVDELVVATTTNATDDPLVALADAEGARWFRGSEHDVLSRYAGAAREAAADVVVRVTSDCPLIDPDEVDVVIAALEPGIDYAANIIERRLPQGLDTEALWRDVLERMDRIASSVPAREHVTWFCRDERPELFVNRSVVRPYDASDLRWTVDTPDDLALVRRLYTELGLAERPRPLGEILAHVRAHPDLQAINAHVQQKRI
jgi:spore coat polysaccharide biosynthesis protein SpsF